MNLRRPYLNVMLLFGAGLSTYYGFQWKVPFLIGIGLSGLGWVILRMGLEALVKRESTETDEQGNTSTFRGCSAIFVGVLWILVSAAFFGAGLVFLLGQQQPFLKWATQHPGFWFIGLGLILLSHGGNSLLGSEEQRSSATAFLLSLPGRLFALGVMLVGAVLFATGAVQFCFPAEFQQCMDFFHSWKAGLIPD
jgi:hypothetical protein